MSITRTLQLNKGRTFYGFRWPGAVNYALKVAHTSSRLRLVEQFLRDELQIVHVGDKVVSATMTATPLFCSLEQLVSRACLLVSVAVSCGSDAAVGSPEAVAAFWRCVVHVVTAIACGLRLM